MADSWFATVLVVALSRRAIPRGAAPTTSPPPRGRRRRRTDSSSGDSCSWAINKVSVRGGFRRGQRGKKQHRLSFSVKAADPSVSVISFSCFFSLARDLWPDNYKSVGSCSLAAALLCLSVTFRFCFQIHPRAACLSSSILIPLPACLLTLPTYPPNLPALPTLLPVPKPKSVGPSLAYLHSSPGVHSYLQYQYIYIVVIWRGQASITATTNSAV